MLRPIGPGDAHRLHDLWSSPSVRRFLWDDAIVPRERTAEIIALSQRMFRERGFGLWGVWPTDLPDLSGFGGLWPFRESAEVELLYGVAELLWGRGYATEIAQAVIAHCFGSLHMNVIRASTDRANAASVRVLEKLGFGFVRRAQVGGLDTLFYELPGR